MNAQAQIESDTAAVAQASNGFALDLYGQLQTDKGNLFFSPYSVDTALAMVYAGAAGQTATEMARTLHLPAMDPTILHGAIGQLARSYQANTTEKKYELHVANALWLQQGFVPLPAYLHLVETDYAARATVLDFAEAASAAKTINDWVSQRTNDKIKDLIPADSLNRRTRLVLTNAVYFKGTWQDVFMPRRTFKAPWHGAAGSSADAEMMHRTGYYDYFEDDTIQAIGLPYAGGDLAMLVLLPKKADGLADLESSLNSKRLDEVVAGLSGQRVEVSLPKFHLETSLGLVEPLMKMGIRAAFGHNADFSGLDGGRDLLISEVVHKAYLDVDEHGTEAAAATGIVVAGAAMRPNQPVSFTADHPFLFLIRDVKNQTILFMGRLADPA